MMKQMMHRCCGPDGRPDFDKMSALMEEYERSSVFDTIGWALLLIWIGTAWLLDLGLGYGLLGVGLLGIGMQAARRAYGVAVEWFWVVVSLGFLIAGFWQLWNVTAPLAPIFLIAIGVALLYWRLRRNDPKD
jgi:hypothetical protein